MFIFKDQNEIVFFLSFILKLYTLHFFDFCRCENVESEIDRHLMEVNSVKIVERGIFLK